MRYDYWCPECKFVEEKQHGIKDEPEYTCPDCGMPMKKYFGKMDKTEGFVLKGGGWFRNDYNGSLR